MRRDAKKISWMAYSFITGFAADFLALAFSAAVLVNVRAALRGVVIAAIVIEVPALVFGETSAWLGLRMERATSEQSEAGYGVLGFTFLCLATAWLAVGLAFADLVTKDFNITGIWPYVGTLALVLTANFSVYLPLLVWRRIRL